MKRLPSTLLYLVAAWCIGIGTFNLTINQVVDFPWVAERLAGLELSRFDPVISTWAKWIGLNLIAAGATLVLLIRRLDEFPVLIWPVAVLSVGVIGAQIFGGGTLGAPPALLLVPATVLLLALVAVGLSRTSRAEDDA